MPDLRAIEDARFVLELAKLMVDRETVTDRLTKLTEENERLERNIAELKKREQSLTQQQQQVALREQELLKREAAVAEIATQAQSQMQRAEERKAEIDALRADLRKAWAA
jgi:hypothetical protein